MRPPPRVRCPGSTRLARSDRRGEGSTNARTGPRARGAGCRRLGRLSQGTSCGQNRERRNWRTGDGRPRVGRDPPSCPQAWSLRAHAQMLLSDTGSETAGGGAAALLLAGFDRLASAGRIEPLRGVLAVALRASRAKGGRRQRRGDASRSGKGGLCGSGRSPALPHRHSGPAAVDRQGGSSGSRPIREREPSRPPGRRSGSGQACSAYV
jgi:hypothetical protein